MKKPTDSEYAQNRYFSYYIEQVENQDVISALEEQLSIVENLFLNLTPDQQNYRYAENKWTPKQILGHLTDTERIFAYRSLCIARSERQSLPGFDENDYQDAAHFEEQTIEQLFEQHRYTRLANIALFKSMNQDEACRVGMANNSPVSARALVFMIAGHELHHINILKERYHF
jgi:uncharacterized damage-inducible protein DinB